MLSSSQPSTWAASWATRCARTTAPSGSSSQRPGGRTSGTGAAWSTRTSPAGSRVADRRWPDRVAPVHSTASLTSPRSDTSSTSTSSGSASWSTPGATFAASERNAPRQDSTAARGGEYARGSNTRRPPARRAGSTKTSAPGGSGSSVTSARTRCTSAPSTSALARASSSRVSSRSTPVEPAGIASRSPPTEQHRSSTGPVKRRARCCATTAEDACSSAGPVHHSSSPRGCLARARTRSSACSRASGPSCGPYAARTDSAARSRAAVDRSSSEAAETAALPASDSSSRTWSGVSAWTCP